MSISQKLAEKKETIDTGFSDEIVGENIVLKKLPDTDEFIAEYFQLRKENADIWPFVLPGETESSLAKTVQCVQEKWREGKEASYAVFQKTDGKLIGEASAAVLNRDGNGNTESVEICRHLSREAQPKKYGTELLTLLESDMAAKGVQTIEINSSRRALTRQGYEIINQIPDAYDPNHQNKPFYSMQKRIGRGAGD